MAEGGVSETSRMTMWRTAIAKEAAAARAHTERWGFLTEHSEEHKSTCKGSLPVKYWDRNGATVVFKKLPMLASDKRASQAAGEVNVEHLIQTQTFRPSPARAVTAAESTVFSHAKSLHTIRTEDPFFRTTSRVYGSRLPIEQFGVSHYGCVQTPITRWDRRED